MPCKAMAHSPKWDFPYHTGHLTWQWPNPHRPANIGWRGDCTRSVWVGRGCIVPVPYGLANQPIQWHFPYHMGQPSSDCTHSTRSGRSHLHTIALTIYSECHRYRYTRGFHVGLAVGTGTGTRLLTRQKPVPVPIMVMSHCDATKYGCASHASIFCFLTSTTTNPRKSGSNTNYFIHSQVYLTLNIKVSI